MPRLFVALELPDEIKTQLVRLCSGVSGAKWVKREQMHLTLRFIGEVDSKLFELIKDALSTAKVAPFDVWLQCVGQFPPKGAARVLWTGVKAPPSLTQLQRQIEAAIVQSGLEAENRAFSPHITLARLKTTPHPDTIRQFLQQHGEFRTAPVRMNEFILYSSLLAPQGPTYRREASYALED
jgi:2'-5' RNA ligase